MLNKNKNSAYTPFSIYKYNFIMLNKNNVYTLTICIFLIINIIMIIIVVQGET